MCRASPSPSASSTAFVISSTNSQTFIYMLTFWCVGGTLILIVDRFEPDRQLAFVLEFVVLALGVAAIARRLLS